MTRATTPSHGALLLLWSLALALLACARIPTTASTDPDPTRLPILDPAYGQHPEHADALALGSRLDALSLPLADGDTFELANANAAGPVVLVWIGGAEHESLVTWVRALDQSLPQFDDRGATLLFIRPLDAKASLRWAVELGLRGAVAADPAGELATLLDLDEPDGPATTIDFAIVILAPDGTVAYRKLGERRPELDELLAVLDGDAQGLRCCPGACVGSPCER
jgi:peroxiredoxin